MKKFSELFEASSMSVEGAMKVLGIDDVEDVNDENKLKSAYRSASRVAHPDRGGSDEKMKQVNLAYEKLKSTKITSSSGSGVDWDAIDKKYRQFGLMVKMDMIAKLDVQAYEKYFSNFAGEMINGVMVSSYPKEDTRSPHSAHVEFEFSNEKKTTTFDLRLSVSLTTAMNDQETKLGMQEVTYTTMVTAFGYHDKRKQKLAKSDYNWKSSTRIFNDPSFIFTKAKMKKIFTPTTKKKKFTRKDALLYMEKRLNADWDGDGVFIPLGGGDEDSKLRVHRSVLNRVAGWSIQTVYSRGHKFEPLRVYYTMPETEETMTTIKTIVDELKKKNGHKAKIAKLKSMLEKLKSEDPIYSKYMKESKGSNVNTYA